MHPNGVFRALIYGMMFSAVLWGVIALLAWVSTR